MPPPPLPASSDAQGNEGYFVKTHARGPGSGHEYEGTFGQRSISTVEVDFSASPAERERESVVGGEVDDKRSSRASSDGVSQEWELELYLKEVEARERRGNFI
jgi:hypothetical protein